MGRPTGLLHVGLLRLGRRTRSGNALGLWSSCSGPGDGVAAAASLQCSSAVWTVTLDGRSTLDDLVASSTFENGGGQPFARALRPGEGNLDGLSSARFQYTAGSGPRSPRLRIALNGSVSPLGNRSRTAGDSSRRRAAWHQSSKQTVAGPSMRLLVVSQGTHSESHRWSSGCATSAQFKSRAGIQLFGSTLLSMARN
jgi:hypothetical protein